MITFTFSHLLFSWVLSTLSTADLTTWDCKEILHDEVSQARTQIPLLDRPLFRVLQRQLERKIIEDCSLKPCGPEQLSEKVQSSVRELSQRVRKIRGYTTLVALLGAVAGLSYFTTLLPERLRFAGQVLSNLSAIGIFLLAAPISEPLRAKVRRLVFKMSGHSAPTGAAKASDPQLESLWSQTQGTYSVNAQMTRGLLNGFTKDLRDVATNTLILTHQLNEEDAREYLIDQLSEVMIRKRRLYRDIPEDDPSILLVLRTSLLRPLQRKSAFDRNFSDELLKRVKELDSEGGSIEVAGYYEKLVETWITKQYLLRHPGKF